MKALVVYDSKFGNTQKVAEAMADSFPKKDSAKALLVDNISQKDVNEADILIVGSPTQGGRPTAKIAEFISSLPADILTNKKVAAFDTRFSSQEHGMGLKLLMSVIGFAAPKISSQLKAKNAKIVLDPEGFIVKDKEGPLKKGEITRAKKWINRMSV